MLQRAQVVHKEPEGTGVTGEKQSQSKTDDNLKDWSVDMTQCMFP